MEAVNSRAKRMTEYVKRPPVTKGFPYTEVLYPGEKEMIMRQERSARGINIEDTTWNAICSVMRELGVPE